MYIKSIIIDGFKSYGQRTEINGFDPLFNAVTGLNGSGKSNILDAICFLLGITNLSNIRVSRLQELVYKNGQAGINAATVSIVFNNEDKKESPIGYEQYDTITISRQIVIGGRNKYMINGSYATNARVYDFFCSVQLNINNPHFLIMQGRITKVLNMKPPEVLSMIEEAAGTRLYESKKQSAEKTIEKKEAKLKEINTILMEEITPTLTRLRAERQAYLEYTKVVRELEHLTKLHVAWQYVETEKCSNQSEETLKNTRDAIETNKGAIQQLENEKLRLEEHIKELEKRKDQEGGGKLTEMEENLKKLQMTETKANTRLQHLKENLNEEYKSKKDLQKNFDEDKEMIETKEQELLKYQETYNVLKSKADKDAEAASAAQKHFQAVCAGLSTNEEGQEATLAEQLMKCKSEIARVETESKQAEMILKHLRTEVKKKMEECKKTETDYKRDEANYQSFVKELQKFKSELEKINYEEGKEENLMADKQRLVRETEALKREGNAVEARFPNLNFEYKDPEPNFDRRKVHGLLSKLFKLRDQKMAMALEVTAGGRLYNVVVSNEETGKKLLDKGQLKRRVTVIPLNKISSHCIDNATLKKAERVVGKGNVFTALSLIDYNPEVDAAMKFVFGNTFICPDMESATKVAFYEGINKRAVTFDGDVFEPAGTLTGGSRPQTASVLIQLAQLQQLQEHLNKKLAELNDVNRKLAAVSSVAEKFRNMKHMYELKERELDMIKTRLQQTTHHQQLEEVESLKKSIEENEEAIKKCEDVKKKMQGRAKDLEVKIKDSKSYRERELKEAEANMKRCNKDAEASSKAIKDKQQHHDSLKFEIEALQKELATCSDQIKAADELIATIKAQIEEFSANIQDIKNGVAEALEGLKAQKNQLKAQSEEIQKQMQASETLRKEMEGKKLQVQQLEHDVAKTKNEAKDASQKLANLLANYKWIAEEKEYFGIPNTEFDFATNNPVEAGHRIKKLKETQDKLTKNVNMRAQNTMHKAEEEYNDLMKKKQIVDNDKAKIEEVIRQLDEKKKHALVEAWEKVNQDFGSIFSTLLPGTNAKLVPLEGKSVIDGLEIKVAFGGVWKDSLSELSGGQRSLVALSLILSLLLFKPAPIYILDEIDAALDLSHTQNIGQMLRTHFNKSQFIIVSLKDGMFSNANVLFKTKFVDGMSTVARVAERSV